MVIYFKETGDAHGRPLLFLHAGSYSGTMWSNVCERLPGFSCILPDLPGHGYSRSIPLQSLEQAADAVAELIQRECSGCPVGLVGLSFGGYVGVTLMVRHPELVERAMISGIQLGRIPNARAMNMVVAALSPLVRLRTVRRRLAAPLGITDPAVYDRTDGAANYGPQTLRRVLALSSDFAVHEDLPGISTPTLMIAGAREHPLILNSLTDFASLMPNCTARVAPGLGHAWCNEDPDLFAHTVASWIEGRTLPAALVSPVATLAEEA